ncbi:Crp/Fnr family transcriptional regulator [Terriglobus roseus]|uniref:cAMP-binding domain of CRP or a regulatory subunit of cAMP-dependent protein kinases n=1 Tax=Terriglobus roseus TaxID=392734 RepID=A0A1H4LQ74_9BACT|nr:Crp/Fnr family transcriptional regulator [Terriglobus roseus]SEB72787.1 cAMP-binding domain of CRP or a regulatory subunit of cAMP-dependent protein kinases [Terriglobus roseus]
MSSTTGNFLLDKLPQGARDRVIASASFLDLPQHTPLFRPEEPPEYIHFLTGGLTSVVVVMSDGGSAEVSMCGREGMVGVNALLGPSFMYAECFMQVTGQGYRIPLASARECFDALPEFRRLALGYVQEQVVVALQTVACNKLHDAQSRLARWMLMVSDRVESNTLALTQEFLAEMLGTQRSTVVLVAGQLQEKGAIAYSRGIVRILDRTLLTSLACECYAVSKRALDNLRR